MEYLPGMNWNKVIKLSGGSTTDYPIKNIPYDVLALDGNFVKIYDDRNLLGNLTRPRGKTSLVNFFEACLPGFDTGGYTGSWGPEGKVAMLHEKEIVLNKTDTKNLLSAVEVLRGMSSSIAGMLLGNAGH